MEQPISKIFKTQKDWEKGVQKVAGKAATKVTKLGNHLLYKVGNELLSVYNSKTGKGMISTDGHHEYGTYVDLLHEEKMSRAQEVLATIRKDGIGVI